MKPQSGYMDIALNAARDAAKRGEVPVGAVVVYGPTGDVVAAAANRVEELGDPTAHAEMIALHFALRELGAKRLVDHDIYVTLEPCAMCAAALSFAHIRRLYYGASDPKGGGVEHGARVYDHETCHHAPEVYGGIDEERCGAILKEFFKDKR
jgi:tRNA(adenine34) deaminase